MGTGKKHYKIGKGVYAERVKGYTVHRYVRRIAKTKEHLLGRLKGHRQLFKTRGVWLRGSSLSRKPGHYAPGKRVSTAIYRGWKSGTIKRKQSILGSAVRAASRSGTPMVRSLSVNRAVTVVPAVRS